ncbi:MAG: ATP-grasp domain-containing protein [Myxococcota bacterium]
MKKLAILIIHDPGQHKDKGADKPDVVVEQITTVLQQKGHSVDRFPIPSDVEAFVSGVRARKPDLIFNLAESFGDNMYQDVNVAAVLELMGIPFTGSDVGGLFMAQDKVLTKKLLAFHGVKYPEYLTFSAAHIETGGNVRFPLFVKPQRADSSLGIHAASLVQDYKSLIERVAYVHETFGGAALAEEYIEGREYYLSVIGGLDPQVLSVVELDFSGLPHGAVHVASYDAKWKARTKAYKGTKSVIAREISDELRSRLKKVAREAYLALRLRDYGRVDVRVTEAGEIYVIEVNPNPYLERGSEVAMSAADAGIAYEDLIERIVEMAWKRRRELKAGMLTPAAMSGSVRATTRTAEKTAERAAEKEPAEKPEKGEHKAEGKTAEKTEAKNGDKGEYTRAAEKG